MKCLASLLLALWVSPCFADQSLPLPVYWSPLLELPSLQAIPGLLAKSDLPAVSFANANSEIAQVTNCNDYLRLTQQGFSPASNMEIGVASVYARRCDALQILAHAKAAKHSFIRGFDLSRDYMALPASLILPNLGELNEPKGDLRIGVPDTVLLGPASSREIKLASRKASLQARVSVLAFGDFSGRGLDEMLIYVADHALEQGTFHSFNTYILTRSHAGAPLTQVKLHPIATP